MKKKFFQRKNQDQCKRTDCRLFKKEFIFARKRFLLPSRFWELNDFDEPTVAKKCTFGSNCRYAWKCWFWYTKSPFVTKKWKKNSSSEKIKTRSKEAIVDFLKKNLFSQENVSYYPDFERSVSRETPLAKKIHFWQ